MKSHKAFWKRLFHVLYLLILSFFVVVVNKATFWSSQKVEDQRIACLFCPRTSITQSESHFEVVQQEISTMMNEYGIDFDALAYEHHALEDTLYQVTFDIFDYGDGHFLTIILQNSSGFESYLIKYRHVSITPEYEVDSQWQDLLWDLNEMLSLKELSSLKRDEFMDKTIPKAQARVVGNEQFEHWDRSVFFDFFGTTGLTYSLSVLTLDQDISYHFGWDLYGIMECLCG